MAPLSGSEACRCIAEWWLTEKSLQRYLLTHPALRCRGLCRSHPVLQELDLENHRAIRPTSILIVGNMLHRHVAIAAVISLSLSPACVRQRNNYDLVILNGRVMDPESGLDDVRNLGVSKHEIRAVTTESLQGREFIDAAGLVVSPGFIDLHQHGQNAENYRYKAADGVTTALELEQGAADVDRWYVEREGKALINYGVSVGHLPVRMRVMKDPGTTVPTGDAARRLASDNEIAAMKQRITHGLA